MKKILAVDDSSSVRQLVRMSLGGRLYEVVEAANGAEGLNKAKAGPFHLVVTDLNMPVMNGIEFIREVRKLPGYSGVPILLLTSQSDDALRKEAKSVGATGWITKPIQQEQLLSVVKKVLGG